MYNRVIGTWVYKNSGGDEIFKEIKRKLLERGIETVDDINLRNAIAKNKHVLFGDSNRRLDELDLFFSYNAREQTKYQMYLYQALNRIVPMINSYDSFSLTEDKFQTSLVLQNNDIATVDYKLCHSDDAFQLKKIIKEWDKLVYKPIEGTIAITKIENEEDLELIIPFLNKIDLRHFYVEKFIKYDNTDFRIDIVNGQFVGCHGRKANEKSWMTNNANGGTIFAREANDEVINIAKKVCKICKLDIARVNIIYDEKKEEYVVMEVNGIPAFATKKQEKILGGDFNKKRISAIVDLIDEKTKKGGKK